MRGKVAKMLRNAVYKGTPKRGKRMYREAGNGAIVVVGPRREYKHVKKQYKLMRRNRGAGNLFQT